MSRLLIALVLILSTILLVNGQTTYSNCKILGNYKAEWTVSSDTLTARFTIPSSTGYAAVGFKSSGTTMSGSTILIGSGSTIRGEYYATSNTAPSALSSTFYTSASSSLSGNTTTLTLVRPLTRPGTSPSTYYSIASGSSMDILFAAHSSSAYPAYHNSAYRTTLDFFSTSSCTSSSKTNSAPSMRQGLVFVVMVVLSVVGLLVC